MPRDTLGHSPRSGAQAPTARPRPSAFPEPLPSSQATPSVRTRGPDGAGFTCVHCGRPSGDGQRPRDSQESGSRQRGAYLQGGVNVLQDLGCLRLLLPIPLKQVVLPGPLDDLEGEEGPWGRAPCSRRAPSPAPPLLLQPCWSRGNGPPPPGLPTLCCAEEHARPQLLLPRSPTGCRFIKWAWTRAVLSAPTRHRYKL